MLTFWARTTPLAHRARASRPQTRHRCFATTPLFRPFNPPTPPVTCTGPNSFWTHRVRRAYAYKELRSRWSWRRYRLPGGIFPLHHVLRRCAQRQRELSRGWFSMENALTGKKPCSMTLGRPCPIRRGPERHLEAGARRPDMPIAICWRVLMIASWEPRCS